VVPTEDLEHHGNVFLILDGIAYVALYTSPVWAGAALREDGFCSEVTLGQRRTSRSIVKM
jgi:hypothetical protein